MQGFSIYIKMKKRVGERFSEFFEEWMCQLDVYLQLLLKVLSSSSSSSSSSGCEQEVQALLSKVTQHYKDYYSAKWALAHEDVLPFFSPVWSTPLESAYSWVTGWKPSTVFKLLEKSTAAVAEQLTEEQKRRIKELRVKVRLEEEKVEREMERQQVGIADTKMVELSRLSNRVESAEAEVTAESRGKVEGLVEVAMKGVMGGLEKVMKAADCVRLRSLKGALDVLNPLQCVELLATMSILQIQLRQQGKQREMAARMINNYVTTTTVHFSESDYTDNNCDLMINVSST